MRRYQRSVLVAAGISAIVLSGLALTSGGCYRRDETSKSDSANSTPTTDHPESAGELHRSGEVGRNSPGDGTTTGGDRQTLTSAPGALGNDNRALGSSEATGGTRGADVTPAEHSRELNAASTQPAGGNTPAPGGPPAG